MKLFLEVGSFGVLPRMTIHTAWRGPRGGFSPPPFLLLLLHIFVFKAVQSFSFVELVEFAFILL